MEHWQWTALILCCFGFLKEFRPSEPFVTEFLIDYKNITNEDVTNTVFVQNITKTAHNVNSIILISVDPNCLSSINIHVFRSIAFCILAHGSRTLPYHHFLRRVIFCFCVRHVNMGQRTRNCFSKMTRLYFLIS